MLSIIAVLIASTALASGPQVLTLDGDIEGVHDPVVIRHGPSYYLFATGGRPGTGVIPIRTSTDLHRWTAAGYVFEKLPEWALKEIPGARNAWAPDISYRGGRYYLYYSVSTFGSRNSAIGLATNKTLDASSPDYKWVDEGLVLRSHQETDDWNAIDPNVVVEDKDRVWLTWGSFWGGIKMRRLDARTGKLHPEDSSLHSLASRPRTPEVQGSIEAPFIVRHGSYWYLFVSFDFCCRGAKSTYRVVAGRSRKITGPYEDRSGKAMIEGGGTPVIEATGKNWRGPGHNSVLRDGRTEYLFFHAYNGETGKSRLQISTLEWGGGWPRVGTLP